jgi:hypothetical protein
MTPIREKFDKVIPLIKRKGIDELIIWLDNQTDFFTCPSSTNYHGNHEEGLLQHSLNVLDYAYNNYKIYVGKCPEADYLQESIIICSLFHDLCKVNSYSKEEKWTKDENNKWKSYQGWVYKDSFPIGHGIKSVLYLQKFLELTQDEILAITFHMGPFDVGLSIGNYTKMSFEQASKEHPLVRLIMASDLLAIMAEKTIDYKTL